MSIGHNTISGEKLRSYVERLERLNADKKDLGEDTKLVKQQAKGEGFDVPALLNVIKIRSLKPHDYAEQKAIEDVYLQSLGMATGPGPLFRFAATAEFDPAVREQVVDHMRDFVPAFGKGDIVVTWGGRRVRLLRGQDGKVIEQDVVETPPQATPGNPVSPRNRPPRAEVPDVDEPGAREMGQQYARDNRPVVDNPFPFGDPRRARFDEGWRTETNTDGMGPDEP